MTNKIILLLTAITLCFSCKSDQKGHDHADHEHHHDGHGHDHDGHGHDDASVIEYPAALEKVFEQHGGLAKWQKMKALTFEIEKEEGNEKTMTDLQNRHERIEQAGATMGYTGKDYWVQADTSFQGNVKFYTNLMFYFYAMPFVLADDGIQYLDTENLVFEDKSYPGIRITYDDGVGISPKDEYFIHYDPQSFEMAWLGYTVTFRSGEKSDNIKWIRYDDWKMIDGFKLPASISWYNTENNLPVDFRNKRVFTGVKVSSDAFPAGTFDIPTDARVIE